MLPSNNVRIDIAPIPTGVSCRFSHSWVIFRMKRRTLASFSTRPIDSRNSPVHSAKRRDESHNILPKTKIWAFINIATNILRSCKVDFLFQKWISLPRVLQKCKPFHWRKNKEHWQLQPILKNQISTSS